MKPSRLESAFHTEPMWWYWSVHPPICFTVSCQLLNPAALPKAPSACSAFPATSAVRFCPNPDTVASEGFPLSLFFISQHEILKMLNRGCSVHCSRRSSDPANEGQLETSGWGKQFAFTPSSVAFATPWQSSPPGNFKLNLSFSCSFYHYHYFLKGLFHIPAVRWAHSFLCILHFFLTATLILQFIYGQFFLRKCHHGNRFKMLATQRSTNGEHWQKWHCHWLVSSASCLSSWALQSCSTLVTMTMTRHYGKTQRTNMKTK